MSRFTGPLHRKHCLPEATLGETQPPTRLTRLLSTAIEHGKSLWILWEKQFCSRVYLQAYKEAIFCFIKVQHWL